MAEEEKKSCCLASKDVSSVAKMLFGVVFMALGAYFCYRYFIPIKILVKACFGPLLVLVGLVFIAISKE